MPPPHPGLKSRATKATSLRDFRGNPDHTILREMFIVTGHNAYRIGELGILRQTEQLWGPGHE